MITNDHEYQVAKAQAEKFEQAIQVDKPADMHLLLFQIRREAIKRQLAELHEQIREYEAAIAKNRSDAQVDYGC